MAREQINWERIIKDKFDMTEAAFWERYHKKRKLGTRSLGRLLGVSCTAIGNRLNALKLERHPPGGDQKTIARKRAFKDVPPER